jgi:hypothetical protein
MEEPDWNELRDRLVRCALDDRHRDQLAHLLAGVMPHYFARPVYEKYFRLWEEHGFHVTPANFYSPVPDTRTLLPSLWEKGSELPGIEMNDALQRDLINNAFPRFQGEYDTFAESPTAVPWEFHFNNGMFDRVDALTYYCMVRHFRPRQILEIGSGYSTRVAARAALCNGGTELVCVEPHPDTVLQAGFPGLSHLIPRKVQELGTQFFDRLQPGDMLFIDTSHVAKIGSEVNFLFLEVVPRLKPGVLIHIHDIFLPNEYPSGFVLKHLLFWNEQYLLQAFLMFNSDFEVVLSNSYMAAIYEPDLKRIFPRLPHWKGGSFWMRRKEK